MSVGELIKLACGLFGEFRPQHEQDIDEDLLKLIQDGLERNVAEFIKVIPSHHIPSLIHSLQNLPVVPIDHKGGFISLANVEPSFFRLVSFEHNEWERTLTDEDLISVTSTKRKLQENRFTAGGISRPVISLEYSQGWTNSKELGLCFWGYKYNIEAGNRLLYVRKVEDLETLVTLDKWLLTAYCYYALATVFITTQEENLHNLFLKKYMEILSIHNIDPRQPVRFNTDGK